MKLEELFNILIEKGWKPFRREKTLHIAIHNGDLMSVYIDWWLMNEDTKSLRELVSKESWLRQFCCENKLVKEDCSSIELKIMSEWYWLLTDSSYQFWLMMCSLKDEEDLEKFLLESNVWITFNIYLSTYGLKNKRTYSRRKKRSCC